MGGFVKKVKKGVKGLFKGVKKAVSKVVKLGKKAVKGVGKFMGKLGPVGMLAVSFIAPYAIGALANMGGFLGTVGQSLQAAQSVLAAPFRAVGEVLGAGVNTLGQGAAQLAGGTGTSLGQGIMSVTEKITTALGYDASRGVAGGIQDIFGEVSNSIANIGSKPVVSDIAMQEAAATFDAPIEGIRDTTSTSMTSGALPVPDPVDPFSTDLLAPQTAGIGAPAADKTLLEIGINENMFTMSPDEILSTPADLQVQLQRPMANIDSNIPYAQPTQGPGFDRFKKATAAAAKSLLSPTEPQDVSVPLQNYGPEMSGSSQINPYGMQIAGASGQDFYGQERTGLPSLQQIMQQQYSLLSRFG